MNDNDSTVLTIFDLVIARYVFGRLIFPNIDMEAVRLHRHFNIVLKK